MSLELSPDAAARTNKAQGAAAEGVASFLPFVQGWQPLVRLQAVVHAVIHICRTLHRRVESLRSKLPYRFTFFMALENFLPCIVHRIERV